MLIMELRMGSRSLPVSTMETKVLSIFTVSTGRSCSLPSEEYPVPKSSRATLAPSSRSVLSCLMRLQSASKNTLSVTSRTSW
jgi:hypothetical protein